MSRTGAPPREAPLAWIIEPVPKTKDDPYRDPYLTLKPEVAEKRKKAGDIVTPYHSRKDEDHEQDEF